MQPTDKISKYFIWKEATHLNQWGRIASDQELTEDIKRNLVGIFFTLDKVRELVNKPIIVLCAFRPEEYNKLVKGAPNSAHKYGMAVDIDVQGLTGDELRALILPKLDEWQLRMEDLPGSSWVHLDTRPPGAGPRFFKP